MVSGTQWYRVDPEPVVVSQLPVAVNALGYAEDQNLYYGIAGSEIVTITADGVLSHHSETPAGLGGAFAGAIAGDRWYLRGERDLFMLDIRVDSPSYLAVLTRLPLAADPHLGDWDIGPADGALYGVDTAGSGAGRVTKVDPTTGAVTALSRPESLPGNSSYGAVMVDDSGVMHAMHNGTGLLYHIPLAEPARFSVTPALAPVRSADAAGCAPIPIPPTPPPPSSPPPVEPAPPIPPVPEPSPSLEPSPSPIPTPSPVKRAEPVSPAHSPPTNRMTRMFLMGILVPAIVAAAHGARRAGR